MGLPICGENHVIGFPNWLHRQSVVLAFSGRSPHLALYPTRKNGTSRLNDQEFTRRLRKLIGRRCRHLGHSCTLIEVLAEEALLVLSCEEGTAPIQADQFGQPFRRAGETRQIPLLCGDGENLSDEALELLASISEEAT